MQVDVLPGTISRCVNHGQTLADSASSGPSALAVGTSMGRSKEPRKEKPKLFDKEAIKELVVKVIDPV